MDKELFVVSGVASSGYTLSSGTDEGSFRSLDIRNKRLSGFGFKYALAGATTFKIRYRYWVGKTWTPWFFASMSDADATVQWSDTSGGTVYFNMEHQQGKLDDADMIEIGITRPNGEAQDITLSNGFARVRELQ